MDNLFDFWHQRGFVDNVTSEELKTELQKPLCAYIGVDPTADSLHLGNLVGVVACAWLQRFGHTPFILIGGGTAKIGDPSGRSAERPLLSLEELEKNGVAIQKQFERLLDHANANTRPRFVNNDQWLSSYSLLGFLRDVGKLFRLGPMLGKESVRSRLHSEEGISFTEFSYQILQAYDFYHLCTEKKITLQVGGSDQWGNITAGVELSRKLGRKTIF
ncbi:MAG: tyrosine--tRNA ligase, partial [Chlamydiota bacterium]